MIHMRRCSQVLGYRYVRVRTGLDRQRRLLLHQVRACTHAVHGAVKGGTCDHLAPMPGLRHKECRSSPRFEGSGSNATTRCPSDRATRECQPTLAPRSTTSESEGRSCRIALSRLAHRPPCRIDALAARAPAPEVSEASPSLCTAIYVIEYEYFRVFVYVCVCVCMCVHENMRVPV